MENKIIYATKNALTEGVRAVEAQESGLPYESTDPTKKKLMVSVHSNSFKNGTGMTVCQQTREYFAPCEYENSLWEANKEAKQKIAIEMHRLQELSDSL